MSFEKALNNAASVDANAIAKVIMLATDNPVHTDEVWKQTDLLYLQWLIADEIMSDKKVRSLKNIIDLIEKGEAAVDATLLRNVPEWKDATENFRTLGLQGVQIRLTQIYMAEEHLRSKIK